MLAHCHIWHNVDFSQKSHWTEIKYNTSKHRHQSQYFIKIRQLKLRMILGFSVYAGIAKILEVMQRKEVQHCNKLLPHALQGYVTHSAG